MTPQTTTDTAAAAGDLRSVLYDSEGGLVRSFERETLDFGFDFRGLAFTVSGRLDDRGGVVRIHCHIGNVPYSFRSSYNRVQAMAIVEAARRALDFQFHMTSEQRVFLTEEVRFHDPVNPVSLVSAITRVVLKAKPYLELLEFVVEKP